jgi:hypothetical protein
VLAAICAACAGKDIQLGPALDAGADAAADPSPPNAERDAAPLDGSAAPELPRFSEPTPIEGIATADSTDDDPSLTSDLTQLYFNSIRAGTLGEDEDIFVTTRADADSAWGEPAPASALNTEQRETGIALAGDGLSILWSSDRPGGAGGLDVYMATRTRTDEEWRDVARVPELSSAGDDLISALADGGRRALLSRRESEDDDYAMFTAERESPSSTFGAPVAIAELDGEGEETDAFLLPDGASLLFSRDGDLHLARRAAGATVFGEPELVTDLNSDADDRDAWAAEGFEYVVFSSERSGQHQLYEARRR